MNERSSPAPRLEALTSLRFLAAMLVVAHHYNPLGLASAPEQALNVIHNGTQAVTFFFILSGFVLGYSHSIEKADQARSAQHFWAARLARIYPLYAIALALSFPFYFYSYISSGRIDAADFLGGLVFVPVLLQSWLPSTALSWNAPAWSLSVEAFFYLTFPFLTHTFKKAVSLPLIFILALTVAVEITRANFYSSTMPDSAERHFFSYFPLLHLPKFLLGIALSRFYLAFQPGALQRHATSLTWLNLLLILQLLSLDESSPRGMVNACLIMAFSSLVFFAAHIRKKGLIHFNARPLILLGEASYGIYILHLPIGMWFSSAMKQLDNADWRFQLPPSIAYLIVVVFASIFSYRHIEVPLRNVLRQRLTKAPANRLAPHALPDD